MRKIDKKYKGFTLIELMIVVTIVGILASTAIPSFQDYLYRAKLAESYVIFGAISTAQKAYFLQNNEFFDSTTDISSSESRKIGMENILAGGKMSMNVGGNFDGLGGIVGSDSQLDYFFSSISGAFDQSGNAVSLSTGFEPKTPETHILYDIEAGGGASDMFMDGSGCPGIPDDIVSLTSADLGVNANPSSTYHWNTTTAVANFTGRRGESCLVLVQTLQTQGGNFAQSPILHLETAPKKGGGDGGGDEKGGDEKDGGGEERDGGGEERDGGGEERDGGGEERR